MNLNTFSASHTAAVNIPITFREAHIFHTWPVETLSCWLLNLPFFNVFIFKIVVKYTKHKSCHLPHFQGRGLAALGVLTVPCGRHHHRLRGFFVTLSKLKLSPLNPRPHHPIPPQEAGAAGSRTAWNRLICLLPPPCPRVLLIAALGLKTLPRKPVQLHAFRLGGDFFNLLAFFTVDSIFKFPSLLILVISRFIYSSVNLYILFSVSKPRNISQTFCPLSK